MLSEGHRNLLMVGPAGSGKTTLAKDVAEALGLDFGFISLSAGVTETHLFGRMLPQADGTWGYVESVFVRIYRNGGVFLLDELDAADANVMVSINAALANGVLCNPVTGEEALDADRCLARSLAPWDRNVREHQARRTVTIGCNLSVNAGVPPKQLLYRGAAALVLADILSSRGLNVGIVLFDSRTHPTGQVERSVTLADGQVLEAVTADLQPTPGAGPLTEKYRPRKLDDLWGQVEVVRRCGRSWSSRSRPPSSLRARPGPARLRPRLPWPGSWAAT